MRLNLLRLAALLLFVPVVQAQTIFHFTEKPGPHSVGLKVVEQYDYSRIYRPATDELGKPVTGERARPLQTLIWYPSQASSEKPMTVGDYGQLAATETSFGKPDMSADWKQWNTAMTPTLKDAMWARRDAPFDTGRFPVVIYAPGFSGASWENADLCEYLASYGYVVIASPDMGATTRDMTSDLAGVNAQARDISFLIGYAQTLPNTDMSELAVAGFSWGGLSNLFAAARDSRIDALVALDGSMRYWPGLIKQAGDVHPDQMTIPLLFFTEGAISLEDAERMQSSPEHIGPSPLNAWTHGDLITVHDLALTHTEHSSMYQRNEEIWKNYPEMQKADYTREDGIIGYAWIARYTLNFLNAYLKHDTTAMAFLKKTPAENGVPQHFLAVSFRAAKGAPTSLEAFRAQLGRQGFDHAAEIYAAMKKESPDFKLEEGAMNDWSDRLLQEDHLPEATALAKLNLQIYPGSSNAYTVLGEIYAKSGNKQLARDNYNMALEKDPANSEARSKLKELDAATPLSK
ncbi:MAG TPA: dienelactone hydrolase family protein [Edaphobacter sp.]|uniref:dienelactone hydrolase family protein n=1 Tax=Edaphobacter sp. TaxID=1934404 RepID=UPI002D060961|nr:dienelactone hydrolase family protein [Edaphobacter sp.]HUZ97387.1 dienelactone hydrolase family protein [Edaphobacter sp.]